MAPVEDVQNTFNKLKKFNDYHNLAINQAKSGYTHNSNTQLKIMCDSNQTHNSKNVEKDIWGKVMAAARGEARVGQACYQLHATQHTSSGKAQMQKECTSSGPGAWKAGWPGSTRGQRREGKGGQSTRNSIALKCVSFAQSTGQASWV